MIGTKRVCGTRVRAVRRYQLQVSMVLAALGCTGPKAEDAKSSPILLAQTAPAPKSAPAAAPVPAAPKAPAQVGEAPALPAPVRVTNPRVAEALRYDPADPLANLETADALDRQARTKRKVDPPKRGCAVVEEPRPVWSETGIANVAASGDEFVVAGYVTRGEEERLFVVRITAAGKLEPIATETLKVRHAVKRVAGPGLAADGSQGITVAYTDGRGKLFVQRLRGTYGAAAELELGDGVDTRFSPAVAYAKRGALIAYTVGSTPMRSTLVRLDPQNRVISTHDITPAAMGAAAPAFVAGASPPILVTADARSGMSPIARVVLDAEGNPSTPEVAVPVGMMSQPPELAAAQSGAGTYVGYTGVGSAATSAVGLVKVSPKVGAPEPLVKGTAYGPLHLDAAASKQAVYFAMDAPTTAGKSPQHDIQVIRVDAQGVGPALRIAAASGDATNAAIARAKDGTIGVVFSAQDGVYFAKLACVD
ncbi:MAG TPA: hypothetical protein VFG30_21365 [Polyangiales bacterium]|nr:hypothetical protein [Polyangiales bacterium]